MAAAVQPLDARLHWRQQPPPESWMRGAVEWETNQAVMTLWWMDSFSLRPAWALSRCYWAELEAGPFAFNYHLGENTLSFWNTPLPPKNSQASLFPGRNGRGSIYIFFSDQPSSLRSTNTSVVKQRDVLFRSCWALDVTEATEFLSTFSSFLFLRST